ncbi:stage IV sporulation protein FA [Amphibacillus marinus]|uniref:Stage IV sporulation protein FA n=1 Tax=Amphibacillus marinus TaxID=872970 RepID=A0A1H8P214_9BACI|nr:M23 family metallopeptidase [Amphibacillus marinus]SEO35960.1 stage IV sporulation protein FA [Amphibacillus marinus]
MVKQIERVRKSFEKRKRLRKRKLGDQGNERAPKPLVGQSERLKRPHETGHSAPFFVKQLVMASVFFFVSMMILQTSSPVFTNTKHWLFNQLREDFPFATVNAWYQEQFGVPFGLFIDSDTVPVYKEMALPVSGVISEDFQVNGQGIVIQVQDEPEVYTIEQGTVIFAGNDRKTAKTVIIQHPDRSKSIYGHLSDIKVTPYQFVYANQLIAEVSSEDQAMLFFSMQKNNQFIDPAEVVPVDETDY